MQLLLMVQLEEMVVLVLSDENALFPHTSQNPSLIPAIAVLSSLFFRLHTTTIKSQTRMFIVLQSTQKGFVCCYL